MEHNLQSLDFPVLTLGWFVLTMNNVTGTLCTGPQYVLDSSKRPFLADSTHLQNHPILDVQTRIVKQFLIGSISQDTDE